MQVDRSGISNAYPIARLLRLSKDLTMIPYKSPLATVVPSRLEVRLEIAKALRTLLEDGDEQLRERRAEIASIRQGLAEIAHDIAKFRRATPAPILSELRKYGYNPEEPRIPKHSTGGGRWTDNGTQFAASGMDDANSILRSRGGHHFVPRAFTRTCRSNLRPRRYSTMRGPVP
jgi:hypothetical protein